jgi:hypothetical protein
MGKKPKRKLAAIQGDIEMTVLARKFSPILAKELGIPRLSSGATVVFALREALTKRGK